MSLCMVDRVEPENPQALTDGAQATVGTSSVFISYSSRDLSVAAAVVELLERNGLPCWIAPRDVRAGAVYADAIVRAISGARALVLVLSENSIASSHVGKEIERASSKQRPIIAFAKTTIAAAEPVYSPASPGISEKSIAVLFGSTVAEQRENRRITIP